MSTYEEMVVDRSVDAAWLQFRVRLADHLDAMSEGDVMGVGLSDGADDYMVELMVRAAGFGGFFAMWEWEDCADRRGAVHAKSILVLAKHVDAYVQVVQDVLINAGALHPSFVEVLKGDLFLVDPPKQIVSPQVEAELPESVMPTSHEDLVTWVDRVITARLGFAPNKRPDGSIGISREPHRLDIRVSGSRPIVVVWATVAKDVDIRRARKIIPKLNATYHFFSFSVVGDRLLVSTTVNAKPFCPEHLDRAIDSTFAYLKNAAAKVRAKVARKTPTTPAAVDNIIDADLLLVFGAAADRKAMIEMARQLSNDSRSCLGQWRSAAAEASRLAKAKAADAAHGPVQNALIDQVIAWRHVADAITDAVGEIVDERRTV